MASNVQGANIPLGITVDATMLAKGAVILTVIGMLFYVAFTERMR
jgi:hypothetical protein